MTHTFLAIFAHPDDEIGVGSTLAHYADAGIRIVLACASRGEAATIFCDDCATPENLAEVRTRELECACANLGISELRWLDWPDGGIAALPRPEAVATIVRLIREVRPAVIITHPQNGLYPHPDHLAVWEIVREAFSAAADPEQLPEAGPTWETARLFTRAMPQSMFDAAPGLADFRVELNGELLPFYGTPDDQIDVTMRVEPWVDRRMAAWECHLSQHNPKGFSSVMPDGMRREMAANEAFLLAAARVPMPEGTGLDLLAGLEPQAVGAPISEEGVDYAAVLANELAAQRAFGELLTQFVKGQPEHKLGTIIRSISGPQQEITYLLARAVRQVGQAASGVEPAPVVQARAAETSQQRAILLQELVEATCERFAVRATSDPTYSALWSELSVLAREQFEAF